MDWIEVTISTNTEGADIVSEALMRQGAVGTQIIDRSDVPDPDKPNGYWELIDRKMLDEMPEDVQVKAWFSTVEELRGLKNCLDALPELTGMDLGTLQISQAGVHEQDWAECWKQYYKPFRAGEHLVIKPSWEAWDEQPGDLVIELDPGMAFGTGTHETTAMCVAMIEKHYHGGEVLDVGTGSGILAIAAARLGAREVLGVELKLVSVDAPNRVEYLTSAKVDIILANFTVIPARAEVVDFALPYMKVALGMVSPDSALITTAAQLAGKTLIVSKGTTAETYFAENHPEVRLLKFDTYTEAFNALLDGRGDALSTDNTEVLAWALENPGFTVGIESLGSLDTIAPAVQKGNDTVRAYIDEEIKALAAENFFHADFDATLKDVYGEAVNPDSLVVEDGVTE